MSSSPARPSTTRPTASGRWARQGLLGQVLLAVDAEEHDHEEEQHHDGAGVDDDLHGGQEVGLLLDEEHGHPEQRHDQHQRGVHGVAGDHHADGAGEHDGGRRRAKVRASTVVGSTACASTTRSGGASSPLVTPSAAVSARYGADLRPAA